MVISITILSSAVAAFRIDIREAGEWLFSANSLIISLPRFGVEIFKVIDGGVVSRLGSMTQREPRGLVTLLGYNPVTFHLD